MPSFPVTHSGEKLTFSIEGIVGDSYMHIGSFLRFLTMRSHVRSRSNLKRKEKYEVIHFDFYDYIHFYWNNVVGRHTMGVDSLNCRVFDGMIRTRFKLQHYSADQYPAFVQHRLQIT